MPSADRPDLTLFLDIVHTLERIGAPNMIIYDNVSKPPPSLA